MKTTNYEIYEVDTITQEVELVHEFTGTKEEASAHIKEHQTGWCEGETPTMMNQGSALVATSFADYITVAKPIKR